MASQSIFIHYLIPRWVFLSAFLFITSSVLGQNTIIVDPSGNGDFQTIQAAANSLNRSSVNQTTIIKLKAGVYDEHVVFDSISGTSRNRPLIIESFSGDTADVLIDHDSADKFNQRAVIDIRKINFIIIRNLSFNTPVQDGHIISFGEGANNAIIEGNQFNDAGNGQDYSAIGFNFNFMANDLDVDSFWIRNNTSIDVELFSNSFATYRAKYVEISNNLVHFDRSYTDLPYYSCKTIVFKNNVFENIALGSFSNSRVIWIEGNKNISPTGSLVVSASSNSDSAAVVINNFLAHRSSLGIQISAGQVKVYHNNIYGYDSTRQNFGIYLSQGDSAEILNNNIVGLGDQAYGMYLQDSTYPSTFKCDYNNWYMPKGTMSLSYAINQVYVDNLNEHVDIFNIDSNSVSVNPLFYSPSDLHIRNALLIGKGINLDLVDKDIDGDQRDPNNPTIGADVVSGSIDLVPQEFTSITGNFYPGKTVQIKYEVKNEGSLDLSTISWYDKVYLSADQSIDNQDVLLTTVTNAFTVNGGASYYRQPSVSIPYISGGNYYLILVTNATEVDFEEMNNNILVSQVISLPQAQLPNLQVTHISHPTSVFSGKSFTVSWTVKNTGSAATTGNWVDYVYSNHDSSFLQAMNNARVDSILKRKVSAPQSLKVNESYTVTKTFSTPIKFSGNLYYRVQTNAENNIFEQDTSFANNGTISSAISVIQSPLPDLTISNASVQTTAFSGDTIQVNWTVKNVGQQKTYRTDRYYNATPLQNNPTMWYDKVVITKSPFYDPSSRENIQKAFYVRPANNELEPDSSYTIYDDISLDRCEYGTYYVFAITNYTNSTFELGYSNNVFFIDSIQVVLKPNPDLLPQSLSVNNSPASGKDIEITYQVINDGFNTKTTKYQKDRFYLHKNSSFSGSVTYLGQNYGPDTLAAQANYGETLQFQIPYDIYGQYYLSVLTDPNDIVCEAPYENNNIMTIGPIDITLSPTPDIKVSADFDSDTLVAGQNITFNITNSNEGTAAVTESAWRNEIVLLGAEYQRLKVQYQNAGLIKDGTRIEQLGFPLPSELKEGLYKLRIQADYRDDVFEHDGENNNFWESDWFFIDHDLEAVPDLEVTELEVSENNITAGDEISVNIELKNIGKTTSLSGWKDLIYVMHNGSQFGIAEYNHLGRLDKGEAISKELKFTLPYNISGDIKLVYVSNSNNKPLEYIRDNNELEINLFVNTYIPPDLEPTNIVSKQCCYIYSLQLDTLKVEVTNNGPGNVPGRTYYAKVYLSEDEFLDKYDHLLGTKQHFSGLNSGNTEDLLIPVKYPSHMSGDLYYIMVVDAEDHIYEGALEDNNTQASGYTVQLSNEITDLSLDTTYVTNYTGSSDPYIYVNYTFSKPLADSLERNWKNMVVLSPNKDYVNNGFTSTVEKYDANLPSGTNSFSGNILAYIPKSTPPGWYYVGILIDSDNEIYEVSEQNNLQFSNDSFYFDFSVPLELDVLKDTFWFEGIFATDVYYNINRPKDTGMIIDLTVSNKNASTEMYHRIGEIPNLEVYDNKYSNPYLADQQIIVPTTDIAVKDYVHVIPAYVPPVYSPLDPNNNTIDAIPYTIKATSKEFSILSASPDNGSVYGNTTIEISGFDFDTTTIFFLTNSNDTIFPMSSALLNSSSVILYLDLRGQNIGKWTIHAVKGNASTDLNDGFEVLDNGFEHPWVSLNSSNVQLTRNSTSLNLNFGNYANTDGFDYWLVLAVTTTSGDLSNLSTYYVGSSEEELNREYGFNDNPTGDSTHFDADGVRYFVYWLPKLAAKSQTTFTYILNQAEEDTTVYYALLFRQPMSNYTLTGSMDDLWQGTTMYEMYESFSNNTGLLNKADFDCDRIDVANVQKQLSVETIKLADHVHGGVSTFSGAQGAKQLSNKAYNAWKQDALLPFQGDTRSKELQEKIIKDIVLEEKGFGDQFKGWVDNLNPFTNVTGRLYKEDPPFSNLMKNVFSCLDNDPDFQRDKSGACLVCSWNTTRTTQRCYQNCDKKDDNEKSAFTRWVESLDPNEIVGPEGTTELRFVEQGSEMDYEIRFENKSTASAPAIKVSINNPLDSGFRLQSFKLQEIGFGDTMILLEGENNLNTVVDLGPNYNNQKLRIVAGVDPVNEQAFWRLTTIDPITGNPVQDPFGGFLPPNDSTGQGEGYVKYTISLKPDLEAGHSVKNQADIIFDNNEIIATNIWSNTVVSSEPFSQVNELPEFSGEEFTVTWYGHDGQLGVGIASYSVYVSKDDSTYQEWIQYSGDTSAVFQGTPGSTYKFYSVIHLLDGTVELSPEMEDAYTTIRSANIAPSKTVSTFLVYPNPGKDKLIITQNSSEPLTVKVYTIGGMITANYKLHAQINEIETSQLASGLYIIEISNGKAIKNFRWIKQ